MEALKHAPFQIRSDESLPGTVVDLPLWEPRGVNTIRPGITTLEI